MKLLLLGATGLVGKNVLAQALATDVVTGVIAPTRHPLAPHPKLRNPVSNQLTSLLSEEVTERVDGVVCALGTTIGKAGSKQAFREVDYGLPLAFAQSAHDQRVGTFVLVSASTANADSSIFYSRTKGELERDIERVGFQSLTIIRPGLIGGERDEPRFKEEVALRLVSIFAPVLPRKFQINLAPVIASSCLGAVIAARPGVHFCLAENLVDA